MCIKYKSFLFRGKEKQLPSLKLTLQVKMDGWNTSFLAGGLFLSAMLVSGGKT